MPAGNGTGPSGMGPMTGRQAGFCAGSGNPGYNTSGGRGYRQGRFFRGAGRGAGSGWLQRNIGTQPSPYQQTTPPSNEKAILKERAEILSNQKKNIEERIKTLEEQNPQKTDTKEV